MNVLLFSVSEGASIDQETNALSVFNILEEITPVGLPLLIQKIVVVLAVEREENETDEVEGLITIKNNDIEIHTLSANIRFGGKRRARLRVIVNGLPIHAPGKLVFRFVASESNFEAEYVISISAAVSVEQSPST